MVGGPGKSARPSSAEGRRRAYPRANSIGRTASLWNPLLQKRGPPRQSAPRRWSTVSRQLRRVSPRWRLASSRSRKTAGNSGALFSHRDAVYREGAGAEGASAQRSHVHMCGLWEGGTRPNRRLRRDVRAASVLRETTESGERGPRSSGASSGLIHLSTCTERPAHTP